MTTRSTMEPHSVPVTLRRELIEQGWSDRAISRMVRDGSWARPRRGAYVDGPVWRALDAAGRHAVTARAVLRQAETEVVLSHTSALPEYGAPTWNIDLSTVDVTRTDRRSGRKERGVRQHSGLLLPEDVTWRNGVPVTSATRLVLDMTMIAGMEESLVIANHLVHEGLTSKDALVRRYGNGMATWPHTLCTDLVLRLVDGRIESVGETRTFCLCFRHGLPKPQPQYEVRDQEGRVVAVVDFAWPELGVFLEFDGRVKYGKLLRPDEDPTDVVVREKKREDLVRELTGWRCIRLTWADLRTPERTAARIRRVLFPASYVA